MNRRQVDFMFGLFVLFGALALIFIALRAANITAVARADTYDLVITFENIGGLKTRSPVKSSGVIVGRVIAVHFNHDTFEAEVEVAMDERFHFPADSIFSIVSSNLLGDQYIAIYAGGEDENLKSGDVIVGNSALILEELIGKFLFEKAAE
jgi:phospholipid/cholesterol/gamma-HCH transport system substrate-binding protein